MLPKDGRSLNYWNLCTVQNQDKIKRRADRRYANKIPQVVTLTDVWLFLPYPLFCFVLEEREVPSPQGSKWYFRLRSSWECGWARTWLHWAVEDWRCSDGSALWRRPGWICYSTWRPADASSQRHYICSGCSHSWGLVNSFSAAAFCRWGVLATLSCQNSSPSFLLLNPLIVASIWMLSAFKLFSLSHHSHLTYMVRIRYELTFWNPDHICPVTTYSADFRRTNP